MTAACAHLNTIGIAWYVKLISTTSAFGLGTEVHIQGDFHSILPSHGMYTHVESKTSKKDMVGGGVAGL